MCRGHRFGSRAPRYGGLRVRRALGGASAVTLYFVVLHFVYRAWSTVRYRHYGIIRCDLRHTTRWAPSFGSPKSRFRVAATESFGSPKSRFRVAEVESWGDRNQKFGRPKPKVRAAELPVEVDRSRDFGQPKTGVRPLETGEPEDRTPEAGGPNSRFRASELSSGASRNRRAGWSKTGGTTPQYRL
jgi:hypothetical protein